MSAASGSTVYEAALAARAAGLCTVPPRQDGSKRPDTDSWKDYQGRHPTDAEFERWYRHPSRSGHGVICGEVSGGLELFEFETEEIYRRFLELVTDHDLTEEWERIDAG